MRNRYSLGLAGVVALAATACGTTVTQGPSQTSQLRKAGALVDAPVVTASPTVFVVGEPTTQTLTTGQVVTMTVGGPVLTNPVAGKPVQFADVLTETFTVTASTTSSTPVVFGLPDFVLQRFGAPLAVLRGASQVTVTAGSPQTWQLALEQTPGQGYFVWRDQGVTVASWSYVAEND